MTNMLAARTVRVAGVVVAVVTSVTFAAGGLAFGTAGSGASGVVTSRGTSDDKITTRGNQRFDVVNQTITIEPGGNSGWHSHPGQAIVVVKSGNFTLYDGDDKTCSATVVPPGQVFIDHGYGHVHIARNEGTVPTELHVTYLDVPVGGAFRLDAARPGNCPF